MHPAVVFYNSEDDEYLVVYSSRQPHHRIRRLGGSFRRQQFRYLDSKKIAPPYDGSSRAGTSKCQTSPTTRTQNNYLLTYTKVRSDHNPDYVASRLISADLNTISAETNLKMLSFDAETAVAAGQNEFMVVWGFNYMNTRPVNSGGTPLGSVDGIFFSTQTSPFRTLHPQVSAKRAGVLDRLDAPQCLRLEQLGYLRKFYPDGLRSGCRGGVHGQLLHAVSGRSIDLLPLVGDLFHGRGLDRPAYT